MLLLNRLFVVAALALGVMVSSSALADSEAPSLTPYKHLSQERIETGSTVTLKGMVVNRRRNQLTVHVIENKMEALYAVSAAAGSPVRGYQPKKLTIVMPDASHDWEEHDFVVVTGEFTKISYSGTPTVTAASVVKDISKL